MTQRKLYKLLYVLLVLMLVPGLFASDSPTSRDVAVSLQPVLAEIAAQQPDQLVSVIVQKTVGASSVEELVTSMGGQVTKDLSIINAFGAEMTAGAVAQLAKTESVRWVSLDAPVKQAGLPNKFSTWSTAVGKIVKNGFTNSANMLSLVGPNGTYGSGGAVKGSFAGFQPEYSPGQKISKVEVVMKLYLSTTLTSTEAPKVTAYAKNKAGSIVTISPTGLNACLGATIGDAERFSQRGARHQRVECCSLLQGFRNYGRSN